MFNIFFILFFRRSSQTHRNTETHSAPGSPKFERKFPLTTTTAITTTTTLTAATAAPTATAPATACSLNSQQLFSENVIVQNDSKHLQNQQSTIYQQQSSQDQESNGQHER